MIKLGEKPPAPGVLSRPKIATAYTYLRQQFAANGSVSSGDFNKKNYWTEVKQELSEYQFGKCCFCERGKDSNGETDVEHFRPKNAKGGMPAPGHHGYWWLSYDWENLFFSCKECNSILFKGNNFPLVDNATRALIESDNIDAENPIFFDLVNEDPEDFIAYDLGHQLPLPIPSANDPEMRARMTIDILGLAKRPNLATGRSIKLQNMALNVRAIHYYRGAEAKEELLEESIDLLKTHTSSKSSYAGFARYYYKSNGLGQYIDE